MTTSLLSLVESRRGGLSEAVAVEVDIDDL